MSGECDYYVDANKETIRTARKQHKCSACGRTIQPRQRYVYHFDVADREIGAVKRCGACEKIYRHLVNKCNEWQPDSVWPANDLGCGLSYEEEWGPLPDEVAAFAFMTDDEASALLDIGTDKC